MTQVLLAVDFEFDLILFELLSEIDDVSIVARPADDVELLALCRTGDADVAIVGFDDVAQAHQGVVPLTSVRQPGYEIGRAAGAVLLQQLADPGAPPPAMTPFAAELVVRESTVGRVSAAGRP